MVNRGRDWMLIDTSRRRRVTMPRLIVYEPLHYLPLLEQKPGAFDQAAPLRN